MKVTYDTSARVAGVAIVPFARLGPERWFSRYAVASYYPWDIADLTDSPVLYSLGDSFDRQADTERLNTASILKRPAFQSILEQELSGYDIHTYKAIPSINGSHLDVRFNAVDAQLRARIENKVEFRALFSRSVRMPVFRVIERRLLSNDGSGVAELLQGRDAVVLQDEHLSGGKGTFVIRERPDLEEALESIAAQGGGKRVVVSDYVAGAHERSVQCCVTKYGVFVGPLQKQIIGDPLLGNPATPGSAKFCGAEISGSDRFIGAYDEAAGYARIVGERLRELGYKGVFGIDCLVTDAGDVFVLEANPRLTGVTPLVTMLWEDGCLPFYLLHILELAGLPYEIEDAAEVRPLRDGGMVLVHSQDSGPRLLHNAPLSGLYDIEARIKRRQIHLERADEGVLWQQYVPDGTLIKPGQRIVAAFMNGPVLDENDALSETTVRAVRTMRSNIELKEKGDDHGLTE